MEPSEVAEVPGRPLAGSCWARDYTPIGLRRQGLYEPRNNIPIAVVWNGFAYRHVHREKPRRSPVAPLQSRGRADVRQNRGSPAEIPSCAAWRADVVDGIPRSSLSVTNVGTRITPEQRVEWEAGFVLYDWMVRIVCAHVGGS